jgi:hypothetical protein
MAIGRGRRREHLIRVYMKIKGVVVSYGNRTRTS